jgi:hypothetical protein
MRLRTIFPEISTYYAQFLVGVFFLCLIILGFFIYRDYGLSWDEPTSHRNGQVALKYILDGDPELWTYSERYYGTLFEMPFAFLEGVLNFSSTQELYFFRHIATFLFFVLGVFVFYRLCRKRLQVWWLALLGPVFLVASPRIFADSFYNSKDIPFMVLFIVAMFTLVRFLNKVNVSNMIFHALATSALIAVRLPGLFIFALTIGFFALDFILLTEARAAWRRRVMLLAFYGVLSTGWMVLLWPFLWQHPATHFLEAFADMSRFSQEVNLPVLYWGESILASKLPWHYIPVWLLITTPIAYTALFLIGAGSSAWRWVSNFQEQYRLRRSDLMIMSCFFGPLLAVILLQSVLYDGWRHMYFIYPALIYIGLVGLEAVIGFFKRRTGALSRAVAGVATVLIISNVVTVVLFMIHNHRYQYLYFNVLAGGMEKARENFELDYWGLTFREGLEYIAARETDSGILVGFQYGSTDTVQILHPEILSRFEVVKHTHAKYVLNNYRWQEYDNLPHEKEVYAVRVDGTKVMSVLRMR